MNKTATAHSFFLKAAVAVMLVQSFVVSHVIKGLVLSYVFIALQFGKDILLRPHQPGTLSILINFVKFMILFAGLQVISQFLNAVLPPVFHNELTLISFEPLTAVLFRKSLFTQSVYMAVSVLFFLYLFRYLKDTDDVAGIIRVAKIGLVVYVVYGFVEFLGFMFTGLNLDFISNRITGEDFHYGLFQTVQMGGLTLQRMKSLAGEPSMFAYSVIPFVVLFYYLKDRIYILLTVALLLSTATTGLLGLVTFLLIEIIFRFKKSFKLILASGAVLAVITALFYDIIISFVEFSTDKIAGGHMSTIQRLSEFTNHTGFFLQSDPGHILFGYGFGYARSTDLLATLLFNSGLVGLILFTTFFIYPFARMNLDSDYRKGLLTAVVVLLVVMFASVTEPYYLHIWFLAALAWYEYYRDMRAKYGLP